VLLFRVSRCLCLAGQHLGISINETSLHRQEGRFCHLLHEKTGLLEGLSGNEKGGQHWRKTVPLWVDGADDTVAMTAVQAGWRLSSRPQARARLAGEVARDEGSDRIWNGT